MFGITGRAMSGPRHPKHTEPDEGLTANVGVQNNSGSSPNTEKHFPPRPSDTLCAPLVPLDQTFIVFGHRRRLQGLFRQRVLRTFISRKDTTNDGLTLCCTPSSDNTLADRTASGDRRGCVESDSRKTFSCTFGRNGSVGHAAAMVLSFWVYLDAAMDVGLVWANGSAARDFEIFESDSKPSRKGLPSFILLRGR